MLCALLVTNGGGKRWNWRDARKTKTGGPWGGQELRGELKTHRAWEPDEGFENNKKRTGKENRKQT